MHGQNEGPLEAAPEMMPERWETAVEDFAQVVALGLDRAQDIADVVNDVVKSHPTATRVALAGVAGVLVGGVLGGRGRRAPGPKPSRQPAAPKRAPAPTAPQAMAARSSGLKQLAPLAPVALGLLKNPLVRDFLIRTALNAVRRQPR